MFDYQMLEELDGEWETINAPLEELPVGLIEDEI